jgi:hypothetical protein
MAEHQLARQPIWISLQSLQKWGSSPEFGSSAFMNVSSPGILLTAHAVTDFCQVSQNRNSALIVQVGATGAAEYQGELSLAGGD